MRHVCLGILSAFLIIIAGTVNESEIKAFAQDNDKLVTTEVGKQVQIASDVTNNQDREQPFAYIVQIKNEKGVSISLSWITGTLSPNQRLNPSLSWTPEEPGTYDVDIFVWESIDDPQPLSSPLAMKLNVVESKISSEAVSNKS